ncbi:MAG TPA: hypothetical protein VFS09_03950 [Candidatus Eisenbacteria bacterium]|nr:hypothetical protein [Candidatus Eisenbacteria bacterium]
MPGLLHRFLALDRRWIFLLVLVSVTGPIVLPLGLPVTVTESTQKSYDYIEALKPGDVVWLSFDYGPSSAPENDPMAEAFMRQCFLKKVRVIVTALYPLGGLGLANQSLARITAEFPNVEYGVDYINLGYKDGATAVMRRLGDDIAGAFPTDVNGRPLAEFPIMHGLKSIRDVKLVFTAATGLIGEYWITQVHSQIGTPVIIGPTAVSAPKYYAFINSGQLVGMLGGMKGAAEYELLLARGHSELATLYRTTKGFTATKGMDGQTVLHGFILLFIVLGNIAFFQERGKKAGAR